jgi:hypothetical protein
MTASYTVTKTVSTFAALLGMSLLAFSQAQPKNMFAIHVTKIKRVNEGCNVEAESTTVRFRVVSDVPSACAMVRAGEAYKAVRAEIQNDPKDRTKDSAILLVYNNEENPFMDKAVFDIEYEEAITRK